MRRSTCGPAFSSESELLCGPPGDGRVDVDVIRLFDSERDSTRHRCRRDGSYTEGSEDGARSAATLSTVMCQLLESVACLLKIGNLVVECLNSGGGKLTGTCSIFTCIEFEQLPDLFKCETRRLSLANKAQATNILPSVMTIAALTRWLLKQSFALVKADGFHAHITCCCDLTDC